MCCHSSELTDLCVMLYVENHLDVILNERVSHHCIINATFLNSCKLKQNFKNCVYGLEARGRIVTFVISSA